MSHPLFSHYQKTLLFGEQCKIEFELSEQWLMVCREAWKCNLKGEYKIAQQMIENFKLMAYREWKESFRKIDRFGGALWRQGLE
jgi:hypothetical protein